MKREEWGYIETIVHISVPQLHRLVPSVNFCQGFVNSLFAGQSLDADPAPVLLLDRALAPVPAGVVSLVGLLEGPRPVRRARPSHHSAS